MCFVLSRARRRKESNAWKCHLRDTAGSPYHRDFAAFDPELYGSGVIAFGRSSSLVQQIVRVSRGNDPVIPIPNARDIQTLAEKARLANIGPSNRDARRVNLAGVY